MSSQLLLIVILTLVNGFFSMSEMALVSVNENKVKHRAEEGDKKSQQLLKLLSNSTRFLSTIQVAITIAGFLSSAFASDAFSNQLTLWLNQIFPALSSQTIKPLSMIIVTIVLAYFTLVFGELVPKRIAMSKPEPIAYGSVNLIYGLSVVVKPIISFLTFSTNFIVKLIRLDQENSEQVTEEEIKYLVDMGEEKGAIMESEKKLIHNIFNFDNTPVADIMTHRMEMEAYDINLDVKELMTKVFHSAYSRIPMYDGSIDNIIGILNVKDMYQFESPYELTQDMIRSILRKPYYVPESVECDELFFDLQKEKIHLAIVIDEYGGTTGLVSMEDLIEEIVGNIFDEYDTVEEEEIVQQEDGSFMISGLVSLDNVEKVLFADLPVDDYETLSGFLIGELGRLPAYKDIHKEIEFNEYVFKLVEIKHRVITKVHIIKKLEGEVDENS